MQLYRLCLWLLLWLLFKSANAQQPSYRQIKVEDGLPSNTVYGVLQDRQGFIWTCGDAGISRFDGENFLNFSIKEGILDNEVLGIIEDGKGRIWYRTLKGKFGCIAGNKILSTKAFEHQIIGAVIDIQPCEHDCILIFTNKGYVYHIDNLKIDFIRGSGNARDSQAHSTFYSGQFGKKIHLWTPNGPLYNPMRYEVIDHNNKYFFEKIAPTEFLKHKKLAHGDFLYFHYSICHVLKNNSFYKFYEDTILTSNVVLCFFRLSDTELLVGTQKGVLSYSIEQNGLTYLNRFLNGKKISHIIKDNEGNFLFSTLGDGLIIWNNKGLKSHDQFQDLKLTKLNYNSLTKRLFCGSEDGSIGVLDFTSTHKIKVKKIALTDKRIMAMRRLHDKLIVATDNTIFTLDKNGKVLSGMELQLPKTILVDGDSLWLGSWEKLYRISLKNQQVEEVENGRTTSLYKDSQGYLWFSNDLGLQQLNGTIVSDFSKRSPLLAERFVKIEGDKQGNLWLASQGKGLVCFNPKSGKVFNIGSKRGLADDVCNSFLIDGNKIWVATNSGIGKVTFQGESKTEYTIQNIGVKQGLTSNSVRDIAKVGDYLYVATSNGLAYFREEDVPLNTFSPPIYISGLKIWDKDTILQKSYTLSYDQNNLKIAFVGLAFKARGEVKYLYKMEGVDKGWVETFSNDASYPSLPAGDYVFRVKAVNEDGVESAHPATLLIVVAAPFWQTWWFWSSIVTAAGGIIYLIVYYRFKALRIQNTLLKQLAETEQKALRSQMNPHFVFNALNSIQRYIVQNDGETAYTYLNKFGRLIRAIFQNSAHKSITIQEEVETLQLYLELEALRFSEGFDYQLEVDENIDLFNREIPSMIIQPFIENAIWHGLMHKSSKGSLYIGITPNENGITCVIQDNGVGRDASQQHKSESGNHKSSAMTLTAQRLKILTETTGKEHTIEVFDLFDDNGQPLGTRVELKLAFVQ